MTEETPPAGYSMSGAALFLAAPDDAGTVAFIREMELRQAHAVALDDLNRLWRNLVERGAMVVRAVKAGADAAAVVHPSLLTGAKPDFSQDTLEIAGMVYHAVRVFPSAGSSRLPESGATAQEEGVSTTARPGRLDFRETDAVLVRVMVKLIACGMVRGPDDAAKLLASEADGTGKESSKVTRLLKRFAESQKKGNKSTHA